MANSWLQSNIAKSQRAVQATEAASQARKRAADTLMSGFQTAQAGFQPMAETQMDIYKQKELFGPEGTMRDYQKDIMGTEAKHASEKEMRMYEQLTGQKAIGENGELTENFVQWKHGYDRKLARDKYYGTRRLEMGEKYYSFRNWMKEVGREWEGDLYERDETGRAIGLKANKKQQLIDYLVAGLNEDVEGKWLAGVDKGEEARQRIIDFVNTYDWGEGVFQDAGKGRDDSRQKRAIKIKNNFNDLRGQIASGKQQYPGNKVLGLLKDSEFKDKWNLFEEYIRLGNFSQNLEAKESLLLTSKVFMQELGRGSLWPNKNDINNAKKRLTDILDGYRKELPVIENNISGEMKKLNDFWRNHDERKRSELDPYYYEEN